MASFAIITGAPPPPDCGGRGKKAKYPFKDMNVGDAFDVPNTEARDGKMRFPGHNRVSASASKATKDLAPKRFIVRLIDDETIRCWRIA